MALQDVLARLNDPNSGYGNEVPRVNAMSQAPALAQAVVNWQKKQRALPVMQALEGYGKQYGAAQTDEERQRANAAANLARATYIKSGGSPIDLPQNLWGGDTSQGFQTGEGAFTPPYAGDNLSIGQKLKQAVVTNMFEGQPTLEKEKWTKSPEAQDWYLDLYKRSEEADIAKALKEPATGSYTQSQKANDLMQVWQLTGKAPAGLESFGITPGTPLTGKNATYKDAIALAQKDDEFKYADDEGVKKQIIERYYELLQKQESANQATTTDNGAISDEDISKYLNVNP